jgi:endonuclease-3
MKKPPAKRPGTTARRAKVRSAASPARRARRTASAIDAPAILARLRDAIPEPRCELRHADAWQLLIATILSAQSTDARVNQVTPELFRAYPTAAALGSAKLEDVERLVRSTGFFRNKAKAIVGASRMIAELHGGQVPRAIEPVLALPGVARKTANVVLGTAYRLPTGIVVDTHAGRVARRLGLSAHDDPAKVEADLCRLVPESDWVDTGHRLVLHGRYVCLARKPACARCPLAELCPAAEAAPAAPLDVRTREERAIVDAAME